MFCIKLKYNEYIHITIKYNKNINQIYLKIMFLPDEVLYNVSCLRA